MFSNAHIFDFVLFFFRSACWFRSYISGLPCGKYCISMAFDVCLAIIQHRERNWTLSMLFNFGVFHLPCTCACATHTHTKNHTNDKTKQNHNVKLEFWCWKYSPNIRIWWTAWDWVGSQAQAFGAIDTQKWPIHQERSIVEPALVRLTRVPERPMQPTAKWIEIQFVYLRLVRIQYAIQLWNIDFHKHKLMVNILSFSLSCGLRHAQNTFINSIAKINKILWVA